MRIWYTFLTISLCATTTFGVEQVSQSSLADEPSANLFSGLTSPEWLLGEPAPLVADEEIMIVRGQTPTFDNGGGTPFYDGNAPLYNGDPNALQYSQPVIPAQPGMVDPFMNPQMGLGAPPVQTFPGVNGPQPYRYGWTLRGEFEYQAPESVMAGGANLGDLDIYGVNVEAQSATPLGPGGAVFINTPSFRFRQYNGPSAVPPPFAIDSLYAFGWDFKLVTPAIGGWGSELSFSPRIATDLKHSIDASKGVNWDGKGALYWQWGPSWTWVLGAMYWDRVDDRILPYGGAIWRPNPVWEFRIMYPEAQAKIFLGNYWGWSHWFYARGEFHSESYQVSPGVGPPQINEFQIEDWRATLGWQFDNGMSAGFVEAGWVFDRQIEFAAPVGPFGGSATIESGLLVRAGLRF